MLPVSCTYPFIGGTLGHSHLKSLLFLNNSDQADLISLLISKMQLNNLHTLHLCECDSSDRVSVSAGSSLTSHFFMMFEESAGDFSECMKFTQM